MSIRDDYLSTNTYMCREMYHRGRRLEERPGKRTKIFLVNALSRPTSEDAFPPEAIMRFRGRTSIDITANVKRTAGLSLKIYSNIHRTAKKWRRGRTWGRKGRNKVLVRAMQKRTPRGPTGYRNQIKRQKCHGHYNAICLKR